MSRRVVSFGGVRRPGHENRVIDFNGGLFDELYAFGGGVFFPPPTLRRNVVARLVVINLNSIDTDSCQLNRSS